MLYLILLFFKTYLFLDTTKVIYNKWSVYITTMLFISLIYSLIYFGREKNDKSKNRKGLIAYTLISTVLLIDVLHHTYFNALPSVKMLSQVGQVGAVLDSVRYIFTFRNILMIIDIPFLIAAYIIGRKKTSYTSYYTDYQVEKPNYIKWGIPALALILTLGNLAYLGKTDKLGSVSNQELFTYHATDIAKSIKGEEAQAIDQVTQEEIISEIKERGRLKEGKHTGIGKDKNLIVIQVEALQNFVINRDYEGQTITPNLNELIKDKSSLYFDNYYQLIGRGNTSDAEFTTNNGLYPSMKEPSYTQWEKNTFYGLPKALKDQGYTPWAFHGFEKDFWNRNKAYKNQGYEKFISQEDFEIKEEIGFGLTDKDFFDQSMESLKELDKAENPFYAFMVTLTSHNPFEMPEKYHKIKLKKEHKKTLLGNYLQSIHYTDEALGEFIQALKDEGLYEDTVIAIYGDHFAISSVQEDNRKLMTDYMDKPYDLDEMMKIPLIINVPGQDINETISRNGSQMDFYPTIMNIMGYDNEKGLVFGKDILNYEGENLIAPQTYAIKGSFIKDDIFFRMSRDGDFRNSTVYNIDTREELKAEDFRKEYERIIAEINVSDYIMENNLLKDIITGNTVDLPQKAERQDTLPELVVDAKSTIKDLEKLKKKGIKAARITLDLEEKPVSEYDELALFGKEKFTILADWLKENPDFYVLARVENEENVRKIFNDIGVKHKEIVPQVVAEISDISFYQSMNGRKFQVLLDTRQEMKDEVIMDIINRYNIEYVAMEERKGKTVLPKKLKENSVTSYIYNVESEKLQKDLKANDIKGFINTH